MNEEFEQMLVALQEISNYAINHEYNNGRIVGRDDLPTLYALFDGNGEYLVIIMQKRRRTGPDSQMPEWFRRWNEEVYQVQPPKWFQIWNQEQFIPLVQRVTNIEHRIDNLIEKNNLIE